MRIVAATLVVFVVLVVVPFPVYSLLAVATGMEPPAQGDSVAMFFLRVSVEKLGHAIAFVGVFALGRRILAEHWRAYAALWWVMFALGEGAMALGPNYTALMAAGGVVAEAIYLPVSALICRRLLPAPSARRAS